jgi:hypothetical protein
MEPIVGCEADVGAKGFSCPGDFEGIVVEGALTRIAVDDKALASLH